MLRSREQFIFEGLYVTLERKEFFCGDEIVFIIENGGEKICIHDFGAQGNLNDRYSKVVASVNNQEIFSIHEYFTAGGKYLRDNPSLSQGIEHWKKVLSELYVAYRQQTLPVMDSLLESVKEQTKMGQFLEKNKEQIFLGALPDEMSKQYEKTSSHSITISAETQVIGTLRSGLSEQAMSLEQQYRNSAERKAKQQGLAQIVSQVEALGNNYVATITNFQLTYAGFDLDERVLPLTTTSLTTKPMEIADRSLEGDSPNGPASEHYKTIRYTVTEKIDYTIHKKLVKTPLKELKENAAELEKLLST